MGRTLKLLRYWTSEAKGQQGMHLPARAIRRLVRHRRLARAQALFNDDLMDALPRHLEVLRQARLIALSETVSLEQVTDRDAKLLRALWIPLGHIVSPVPPGLDA